MRRGVDLIMRILEVVIALCLAVMVALVFGNVVLRYGFGTGIAASEEIARLLFVWLVFLGAIIAMRARAHVGFDLVVRRLPPLGRKLCLIAGHLLMLYGLWLFLVGGWRQTLIGLQDHMPVTGWPRALVDGAGVLASLALAVMLVADLLRLARGRLAPGDLVQVAEDAEGGQA